jgi:alkylation response protein AidB-like acyl-CoA dehydrogenase
VRVARANGRIEDAVFRDRLTDVWAKLQIMRYSALRSLSAFEQGELTPVSSINKLYWSEVHQELGVLAMSALGMESELAESGPYELTAMQRAFLFSRADSIYGGSNQIQRNIIGERMLGLPPEPKVV